MTLLETIQHLKSLEEKPLGYWSDHVTFERFVAMREGLRQILPALESAIEGMKFYNDDAHWNITEHGNQVFLSKTEDVHDRAKEWLKNQGIEK